MRRDKYYQELEHNLWELYEVWLDIEFHARYHLGECFRLFLKHPLKFILATIQWWKEGS